MAPSAFAPCALQQQQQQAERDSSSSQQSEHCCTSSASLAETLCTQSSSLSCQSSRDGCTEQPSSPADRPRWNDHLQQLQSLGDADVRPEQVCSLLQQAVDAVRDDPDWRCSGLPELLGRALDMAKTGCPLAARKAAVGCLGFHSMVLRYRQSVTADRSKSSSSGGSSAHNHHHASGKRSAASAGIDAEDDADSGAEDVCTMGRKGSCSPRGAGSSEEEGLAVESTDDSDHFAVPELPASAVTSPRQQHGLPPAKRHQPHAPSSAAAKAKAAAAAVPSAAGRPRARAAAPAGKAAAAAAAADNCYTWSGAVKHQVQDAELPLAGVSIQVPRGLQADFEGRAELQVSHFIPRKGVMLGRHSVCRSQITSATGSQVAKLRSLAQYELVAVVPLEDNGLILVPYLDNNQVLKVVCFLLVL